MIAPPTEAAMATERVMATLEAEANARTRAALDVLTERFGLDLPVPPAERLDARMAQIRVIQRHADVLDALVAATGGTPETGDDAGPNLERMSRAELDSYAAQRGVAEPMAMKTKADVIAAIDALDADEDAPA